MQAVWRWLWDTKSEIPKDERPQLMKKFRTILYSSTADEAETAFRNTTACCEKYSKFQHYLNEYWKTKEMWCLAWQESSSFGHHTDNFTEVAVYL